MMTVRDGVLVGLQLMARHYPSFAKDGDDFRALVDDYERALCFTDGDTIAAGFRVALERAGKFPPRYPEIVGAVQDTHRRRNVHAQLVTREDSAAVCVACGTEGIVEVPHPHDPTMPARLYPLHRDGCVVAMPRHYR